MFRRNILKTKISCYIRTKNEEDRIGETVRAALFVADEVVVIDSCSNDNTVIEAERAGAIVFSKEWSGLGFQKRYGEEACQNNWVLDLDADEVISSNLANNINKIFSSRLSNENVFEIQLKTVDPSGKVWSHQSSGWRKKIYNKTCHRMPKSLEWDQLQNVKSNISRIDGTLLHYSFRNLEDLVTKFNSSSSRRATLSNLKPKYILLLRMILGLPFYFLKFYLLRRNFIAGFYGFSTALVSAISRWLTDVKMYERYIDIKK